MSSKKWPLFNRYIANLIHPFCTFKERIVFNGRIRIQYKLCKFEVLVTFIFEQIEKLGTVQIGYISSFPLYTFIKFQMSFAEEGALLPFLGAKNSTKVLLGVPKKQSLRNFLKFETFENWYSTFENWYKLELAFQRFCRKLISCLLGNEQKIE